MKEYIQHRFYADGYSYIITFKNGDYIMKMYLGQYIDGLNIIEQKIVGVKKILDYLVLRCIPMEIYLEIEKLFLNEIG